MKKNTLNLLCLAFSLIVGSRGSLAITTQRIFDAEDNSGWVIRVSTRGAENSLFKIEYQMQGDAVWVQTILESVEEDLQNAMIHANIKWPLYHYVFDLTIWFAENKLIERSSEGKERIYMLRK